MRNLHTCSCFLLHIYVNICLNKNKGLAQQNLKIVCKYWKKSNLQSKRKKVFDLVVAKAKNVEPTEAFIEAFSSVFTTQSNI